MKKLVVFALSLVLACGIIQAAEGASLTIAKDKKSSYVIVVSKRPIPAEVTATKELQEYIHKITGVMLPIIPETQLKTGKPAIMVGHTEYALSKGVWTREPEKWLIKTVNNRLILTGGRPRGTLYAVYHFLEDVLGVRWWTIWDESVPKKGTLTIPDLNRSGQPGFAYRDIFVNDLVTWPEEYKFFVRNRLNGHFSSAPWEYGGTVQYGPPYHVHTFNRYFPPSEYFESHPEYYSLSKGKRIENGQLCLTNPDVLRIWIEKMKKYIKDSYAEADEKGEPRPVYYAISQNDWLGNCECDNCRAVYENESHSALSLAFVNAVAEEIEKEYPNVLIDTLAYWFYEEAPKNIKPRHNVRIRLCDVGEDIMHPINHPNNKNGLRRLDDWSKIAKRLDIWKYGVIYRPNLPIPSMLNYWQDVQTYKKYNVNGVFVEMEQMMTTDMWEMKIWMLSKLYENPYADSNALIKEFTDGYYGAAGKYIREYLNVLHKALQEKPIYMNFGGTPAGYDYLNLDLILKCNDLFEKADATVANQPTIRDRVTLARTSLDRAICYRSFQLIRDYKVSGSTEPYKLQPELSAKRAVDILRKMSDARFPDEYKMYAKDAYTQADSLELLGMAMTPIDLPAQFSHLPASKVFDFSPGQFRIHKLSFVDDADAAYGRAAMVLLSSDPENAVKYHITPDQGLLLGVYNAKDKIYAESTHIPHDQIKSGYNFYKLSSTPINHGDYFYMFWSWAVQQDLDFVVGDNPDQLYDIYVSVKFEGPSFPNANPNKPDAIYVDRLIVVALD